MKIEKLPSLLAEIEDFLPEERGTKPSLRVNHFSSGIVVVSEWKLIPFSDQCISLHFAIKKKNLLKWSKKKIRGKLARVFSSLSINVY